MFVRFVQKFAPKVIANPALLMEAAPIFLILGVAAAIQDMKHKPAFSSSDCLMD